MPAETIPTPTPAGLYPRSMVDHRPCRSLGEYQYELRGERIGLLLRQMKAEEAGDADVVTDCLRRIRVVEARLREIAEGRG